MINIVVIEDKEDQLEDIENNLHSLLGEFKMMPEYKDSKFNLIPIDTRKEVINDAEGIQLHVENLMDRINPHILIIDYDLEWGVRRVVFDGDRIVELIEKNKGLNPYVILASSQFDQKKHPKILVESGRIPARAKKQLNKGSFTAEWTRDDPKRRDVKDAIVTAIQYVEGLKISFDVFKFPTRKDLIDTQEDGYMLNCRQEGKNLHTIRLQSNQIVAILLGERYTYSLIVLSSSGNLIPFCIHFVNNIGKSALLNRYKFLNDGLGVIYNPDYLEYVEKEFRFNQSFVQYESIKKFNTTMNFTIEEARKIEIESTYLEIKNIHPMYAPLVRFQGVG